MTQLETTYLVLGPREASAAVAASPAAGALQKRFSALLCASALVALAIPSLAYAQDNAASTAPATSSDDEEIVVTAQRREEPLVDVPMTVSVVTNELMEKSGVTSLRDIVNVTSGVQLNQGGAFPQPAIRGVSTISPGTFENNVALYVDGLYQPASQTLALDLPNVESVQILKGPQGTLYGRNATGGAILLNTMRPRSHWEGKAELTYARFDDKRASGYISGPLNDMVGISLAGYIRRSDGYYKLASRTTPGETDGRAAPLEQDALRAKVKLDLNASTTMILAYNYVHTNDPRGSLFSVLENVNPSIYSRPGGATRPTERLVAAWDIGTEVNTKQHEVSMTLEADTAIGDFKSVTGFSHFNAITAFDFDGSYVPTQWSVSDITRKTFQQYIDYAIDAIDRVDLLVGASYYNDRLEIDPNSLYFGLPSNLNNPGTTPGNLATDYFKLFDAFSKEDKDAWAAYVDATFHATDKLSLTAGGRYSSETQHAAGYMIGVVSSPSALAKKKYSKFTPRAAIRYEISPRTNIYATYTEGFRSGAFGSIVPLQIADQESVRAFELGFKMSRRRFRAEIAGFYYDYKDLQVSVTQTNPVTGQIQQFIGNAPSAKIYGIDASFDAELIENLNVRGGATWLHARYGENFLFTGVGVSNSPAQGGGVGINVNSDPLKTYLNITQGQNLSGLQMSRAPNLSAFFGLDYRIPMGDGGFLIAANVKYTDSYVVTNPSVWGTGAGVPVDRQREQRFREGNYALLNASVTWTDPTDSYFVRIWGTNLTNHIYRLHYNGVTGGTYMPSAEPRSYGVTAGFKFGN